MSWRTNSLIVYARGIGRRLGLNRLFAALSRPASYEDGFNRAILARISEGDCVWDVGANVGHYTGLFAAIVGERGRVFAFEPSPENFRRLSASHQGSGNVTLLPFGLGDQDGAVAFAQGDDTLGATSRVVAGGPGPAVDLRCADGLLSAGKVSLPAFIKIDVEGYEWEVLAGLKQTLRHPGLKGLGIEIHYGLLGARGLANAPRDIETLLQASGFRCTWPDSSHIVATRPS